MLSISEFSEMCHLSPQTLRYYHAEGLLVPAAVDQRTGYRSYAFEQVEQAMLITLLRDAGMSVELVRQTLDDPTRAVELIDRHSAEVDRRRTEQDEAIQAARTVFGSRPEVRLRHVPAATVAGRLVHGTPLGRTAQEWEQAEALIEAAVAGLVETVRAAGVTWLGGSWRVPALETREQDRRVLDGEGPFWIVKVPVSGPVEALPADVMVQEQAAHDELSIFMPGRNTMSRYGTAILRLLDAHTLLGGERFVNLARLRHEVHDDGVLFGAPVEHRPD